jgi:acetylglutamate kinase
LRTLIKLGGTLLDAVESRSAIAAQIAELHATAPATVVVHGGGKQMTRFLAERGVESRFVRGLRVTSPEVVDAVLKVFAGSVNKELVASLIAAGAPAVGLSGIDGALAVAEPLDPELGAVGKITQLNAGVLEALVGANYLPVVACVAGGRGGVVYNVNADQMAVACATGFRADRLIFLTDVEGVRGADGSRLSRLTSSAAKALIEKGIATGGMQAKLEAACAGLEGGAGEVVIAPGAEPGVVRRLLAGEEIGTRLVEGAC